MKRFTIVLGILLYFLQAFSQDRFGIMVRCSGQANFAGVANVGSTFGVVGMGVLHAGILDLSLGIGYSYNPCSYKESQVIDIWHHEMTYQMVQQRHFLNVPFAVSVQCWQKDKFRLKIYNELEYNRLCKIVEFVKGEPQTKTIEKLGDIPHEAVNGLTYRLGLTATYSISDYCILSLSPLFGVKAMLNQYQPYPSHAPHDVKDHNPIYDHRFSSGVIIGMEYRF